jgi:ribosome-associated protein
VDRADRIAITETLSIPASELEWRFSSSGGPGGQHANRSATRVTLLFDVARSPSLTESQRERLLGRLAARIGTDGVLQVHAQDSRSQSANREAAIERFRSIMAEGLRRRRRRRRTALSTAQKRRRLEEKRRRGEVKKRRGRRFRDEEDE